MLLYTSVTTYAQVIISTLEYLIYSNKKNKKTNGYNVRGISNPIKRKKVFGQLQKLHCSVALLQETHLPEIEHLKLKREWVDQVYSASCRRGKKRGVAILFNKSVYYNNEKIFQDEEG